MPIRIMGGELVTTTPSNVSPVTLTKAIVLDKTRHFVDTQLWPTDATISPEQWLKNFRKDELEYALHLLNGFVYFNERLMGQLFKSAFHGLSRIVVSGCDDFHHGVKVWREFLTRAIITIVTDENPSLADSGFTFARKARDLLGIDGSRLMEPARALEHITRRPDTPVVFVDDFVGTGAQFRESWQREMVLFGNRWGSFAQFAISEPRATFYYCPPLCTEYGYGSIRASCPQVILSPAHILSSRFSVLAHDSLVLPKPLRADAPGVLRDISLRYGMPDTDGVDINDWQGFHKLGLAIGFWQCVPDATMALFRWEGNGWKPLIRRR